MLNDMNIDLFYKLLDTLGNSLRDLTVKYELLMSSNNRQDGEHEKASGIMASMAQELSSSFSVLKKNVDQLQSLAGEGKDQETKIVNSLQSMGKEIDVIDSKLAVILKEVGETKVFSMEGKAVAVHVDSHMDGFGVQLSTIQAMSGEVTRMTEAVEEMKILFKPIEKIALLFTKPAAVIIAIYFIISTTLAVIEGFDLIRKARGGISGVPVSTTSAPAGPVVNRSGIPVP